MNVTFYGHACFSVEISGKTLLFDPFISPFADKGIHLYLPAIGETVNL